MEIKKTNSRNTFLLTRSCWKISLWNIVVEYNCINSLKFIYKD